MVFKIENPELQHKTLWYNLILPVNDEYFTFDTIFSKSLEKLKVLEYTLCFVDNLMQNRMTKSMQVLLRLI